MVKEIVKDKMKSMRGEPTRILQAFVAGDGGGLTAYICQNYKAIDRQRVQFDFLTFDEVSLPFEDEFCSMGARFFHICRPTHFFQFYCELKKILSKQTYAAVHFHLSYANFVPVLLAKLAGAKVIISHSHSTDIDDKRLGVRLAKRMIHNMGRCLWPRLVNEFFACSQLAGEWMYTSSLRESDKYHLAHNGIDVNRYAFSVQCREAKRAEMGFSEQDFVLGHVGRFCYQKNQAFLIDVFNIVSKKMPHAKLLLIGTGEDEQEIRGYVRSLGLSEKIQFLGKRKDVPDLLQAMDVFVLPSRFEGLGIVGVEAQAAGLPCLVSDKVPRELVLTDLVGFLPLSAGAEVWAEAVLETVGREHQLTAEAVTKAGYDIHHSVQELMDVYMSIQSRE